jgi:hypothetical protein
MSLIYLETMGGLANRMRLLASGLWLKGIIESKVVGFWGENKLLNCSFHQLFQEVEGLEMMHKNPKFKLALPGNSSTGLRKNASLLFNKVIGIDYYLDDSDFVRLILPEKLDIVQVKKNADRIYFRTCREFGDNTAEFQKFRPITQLSRIVSDITSGFSHRTIGIHIRRTDNIQSIRNSPTELFISTMHQELKIDPATLFFVCTDDRVVENQLKDIFGNSIITYPKELSRLTKEGIQGAVVDMFCLANTSKIYGSYWSSFSEVSARIKGVELTLLQK